MAFGLAMAIMQLAGLPANAGIAPYVQPQPYAPVQITGCFAGVQFVNTRWGTSSSNLNTGVDFKNISSKTVVAVLFRLQLANAFGNVMDNQFAQATGDFAPDAVIKGNHWSDTDTWPGLGIIQCTVNRVLFSDGAVWNEPRTQPSPVPSQSP